MYLNMDFFLVKDMQLLVSVDFNCTFILIDFIQEYALSNWMIY